MGRWFESIAAHYLRWLLRLKVRTAGFHPANRGSIPLGVKILQSVSTSLREDRRWCAALLPKVSRTFALNIGLLRGELREAVLVGYLICRALDSIEDGQGSVQQKKIWLKNLIDDLAQVSVGSETSPWNVSAGQLAPVPAEKTLLVEFSRVLRAYRALPAAMRTAMLPPIHRMAEGMAEMLTRFEGQSLAWIRSLKELEEYCYYVAGTVGEMLTALFRLGLRPGEAPGLEPRQVAFGLGLQFTNILKDWRSDLGRGWCYLPRDLMGLGEAGPPETVGDPSPNSPLWRVLFARTLALLGEALAYTSELPRRRLRTRWFCAVPLLLAVDSLVALTEGRTKMSRSQVFATLRETLWASLTNRGLQRAFAKRRLRLQAWA